MAEPMRETDGEAVRGDDLSLEAVLARFDNDPRAALAAALGDIAYLRDRLAVASLAMSYGFARGWKPSLEKGLLRTCVAKNVA